MEKVNLVQKLSLFNDYYSPKIVGELNDLHVKVVKLQGEFVWHHHDVEDELFFVVKGALRMAVRENGVEREIVIQPGEFLIILTASNTVPPPTRRRTSCCSNPRPR